MKCEIYKITNIKNNKSYIGITTKGYMHRWSIHKRHAKNKINRKLYDTMNFHGLENFKIEVLEIVTTIEEMFEKEKYYIKYYKTYFYDTDSQGYNMTRGGEGTLGRHGHLHPMFNKKHSDESRKKISKNLKGEKHPQFGMRGEMSIHYGKKLTMEHKMKISASEKGKQLSQEQKNRISKGKKGKPMSENHKKKLSNYWLNNPRTDEQISKMIKKCRESAPNKIAVILLDNDKELTFLSLMECARFLKNKHNLPSTLNSIHKKIQRYKNTDKLLLHYKVKIK